MLKDLTSGGILEKEEVLDLVEKASLPLVTTNKKISYYNIPCAFDIETSSFYATNSTQMEKQAIMYEWTFGIDGAVCTGRTWNEFLSFINSLAQSLALSKNQHLIIYIHNLSYEFQFMRSWFEWESVFSLDERKPVKAITASGVEFRCSYKLSGYSLSTVGKNLVKYKCEKMSGDLDYEKIRTPETPLSPLEWKYCENDVRVVMCYIQERIEQDGDITRIPLTQTGYVRNYCRNNCFYPTGKKKSYGQYFRYRKLMGNLTLSPDEYLQLKHGFMGGFTHANAYNVGKIIDDVTSMDFTSSYPSVMICEKFPMSTSTQVEISSEEQLDEYLRMYCCLFDVEFHNLREKITWEHPLPLSKCWHKQKYVVDNGRVVYAETVALTVTEQDWFTYKEFYSWDSAYITNFRYYYRNYLPKDFVRAILKLYADKTQLKGIEGKEVEYMHSKQMANSAFGMTVTDIARDEIVYSTQAEWSKNPPDLDTVINKYNNSKNRFLFYPWGVWVTAYARRNLFSGIYNLGQDYVYSDTDSVKFTNADQHEQYFKWYNAQVTKKMIRAMEWHKLPLDSYKPKTKDNVEKPLGVWDYDGHYDRFKTLGAKRYMYEKNGKLSLTISGVNKFKAVPWLQKTYGSHVMENFQEGLEFPVEATGKNVHTYLDDEQKGVVTDYLGKKYHYYEKSSVHLEGTTYNLSLAASFVDYLMSIGEENVI